MKLYKDRQDNPRKADIRLLLLFVLLAASYFTCIFLFPKIFFRSWNTINKAYWYIASVSQEKDHNEHCVICEEQCASVSIMFDDGWISQYNIGFPIMTKYGLKGSVGVISSLVGEHGYMGIGELSEMYRQGWDMVNHTKSHLWLNNMSVQKQREELLSCRNWLKRYHMTGAENIAVFPGGYANQDTFEIMLEEGFTFARSIDEYWSISSCARYDDVRVVSVTPQLTLSNINTLLDTAIREKSVLILIFHALSEEPDEWEMCYPPVDFEKVCEIITQKGLRTFTVSELARCLDMD